jgi:hypothetical protein
MANTKHSSKYKAPKDLEKSQKPQARKDLKDYTEDDKDGALNPKSTREKQRHVIRKTDKEIQDDGKMFPKYDADDRLYKDIEDGEYDPIDAAKKMEKREKAAEKTIKDKIDNLTVEQKEQLVREYIRRKIAKVLREQTEEPVDPAADPAVAATDPAADPNAAPMDPAADPMAADTGMGMDMGGGGAAPAPPAPADAPDISGAETPAPTTANTTETPDLGITVKDLDKINQGGTITKVKGFNQLFDTVVDNSDPEDAKSFYKMIARLAAKKYRGASQDK